ncbi:MAG: type II toxin-antitoxin system Phd/YefM family antitoxin [Betaproteobacteria bacterium]|nr:type II toxin-antitoxin system Phd/YefM family antitoxin [Betaproteobacteria bacterium]
MNSIPASEVKRRGVAALVEAVENGPVHVIKNNRPTLVVLTEAQYYALSAAGEAARRSPRRNVVDYLLNRPHKGTRTKKDIDASIRKERGSWEGASKS